MDDTRRLVDGIIDFRHKVVADALVNAILFEDNLERVERYVFKLKEFDFSVETAEGLNNAIHKFVELR